MKDLTITAIIKVYQYDELNEGDRSLIKTAMEATARSYSPYSHFSVGAAALLGNGTVVQEPIRKMRPIRRGFVQNVLPYSMPTPNIPTNRLSLLPLRHERKRTSSTIRFLLRCLPASDSGNGKALQTTHPHPIIWQRMYLRSKKYRRSTAVII